MFKRLFLQFAALAIFAASGDAQGNQTRIMGTIAAIEGDHIQIKDQAGKQVIVMLEKNTKYSRSEKPATKAELKVGTRVTVDARMDEKMKMYAASEVVISVTETAKPAPKTESPAAR